MTTRVLLLRHAEHDLAGKALAGRLPGLSLNAAGRAQARALADVLAGRGIQAIHATPQPRTGQTVQPLAERLGLAVRIAPEFDEIDFGDWTGLPFEAVRERDPRRWRQWVEARSGAAPPGGEAFAEVARRTSAGLARLRAEHPGQCVLVVSHADVIKATLAGVLGLPLDHLERFEIACAGLSVVDAGEGWAQVKRLNEDLLGG